MIRLLQGLAARRNHFFVQLAIFVSIGSFAIASAAAEGDAEAGKAKSITCTACHGPDGNSVVAMWPSIAGQHANYLADTLAAFKAGTRSDPVMTAQAMPLSEADIADLAAYYSQQTGAKRTADPKLVAAGERLYRGGNTETNVSACIACHGPTGRGNPLSGYPSLSGQHAVYTEKQLNDYKNGLRKTDGDARVMRMITERMTSEEIKQVSAYIQGLR
jgi:cytochrome c553